MARNLSSATIRKYTQKVKSALKCVKKGGIGSSIRKLQEGQCLPYAGFFGWLLSDSSLNSDKPLSCRQLQINLRA